MGDTKTSAGALIISRATGRLLLLLRNEKSIHPLTWSIVAGHIKENEDILNGLKREINEETGINSELIDFYFINKELEDKFYYFIGFIDSEITCNLNDENLKFGWFDKNHLPYPLYPDLDVKIKAL